MKWQRVVLWVAVAAVAVLVVHVLRPHGTAVSPAIVATAPMPQKAVVKEAPRTYLAHPNQLLATVDGMPVTLGDLMPLRSTNSEAGQQMDVNTYNYLLQRAINRLLIMEAAQAKGIALSDAQQEQLEKYRALREQSEPGLITKLTLNSAQIDFELQDAEAFMLQTSLMAAAGYTPDVTPDEVQQYYQDHISQYGQLPDDPQARQQAWQTIEYEIREALAGSVRAQYQQAVDAYMAQLQAKANISEAPPAEAGNNLQAGS